MIVCDTLLFLLCFKGEADIIEGANSQGTNEVTLHTSTGEFFFALCIRYHIDNCMRYTLQDVRCPLPVQ
jgi:hypothetical protein